MENKIRAAKTAVRNDVRTLLKRMQPEERRLASARARALLQQQPIWKTAQSALFFAPMPEELDVWPLVGEALGGGKAVFLPRFDAETNSYTACQVRDLARDIKPGQFGIREAADQCDELSLNRLDFILVP